MREHFRNVVKLWHSNFRILNNDIQVLCFFLDNVVVKFKYTDSCWRSARYDIQVLNLSKIAFKFSFFCENMRDMLAERCPFSRNIMKYYFFMTS